MDWNKYFKGINEKAFFDAIMDTDQYRMIKRMVDRLLPDTRVEYTIMEDWGRTYPFMITENPHDIWQFFTLGFGEIKQITNDFFYIKTKNETIFLYTCVTISGIDDIKMNVDINITRCFEAGKELIDLWSSSYTLRKKSDEVYEILAEKMYQEKKVKIIQKRCHNWLWKPICNDGKMGINAKIGWDNCMNLINN